MSWVIFSKLVRDWGKFLKQINLIGQMCEDFLKKKVIIELLTIITSKNFHYANGSKGLLDTCGVFSIQPRVV